MYRFVHSRSDRKVLGPPQCLRNGVLLENAMQRTGFMYGYYLEESWDGCQWHGCEISNIHSPSACFSWMISNWWPTITTSAALTGYVYCAQNDDMRNDSPTEVFHFALPFVNNVLYSGWGTVAITSSFRVFWDEVDEYSTCLLKISQSHQKSQDSTDLRQRISNHLSKLG